MEAISTVPKGLSMKSVRRSSTLVLAAALAVGSLSLAGCGGAAKDAVSSAAGAASSAAAAAIDKAAEGQIDDALDDSAVKTQVCDQLKSNADTAYQTVVGAINSKKAGAGDALAKVVSVDQFKSYMTEKCA